MASLNPGQDNVGKPLMHHVSYQRLNFIGVVLNFSLIFKVLIVGGKEHVAHNTLHEDSKE